MSTPDGFGVRSTLSVSMIVGTSRRRSSLAASEVLSGSLLRMTRSAWLAENARTASSVVDAGMQMYPLERMIKERAWREIVLLSTHRIAITICLRVARRGPFM